MSDSVSSPGLRAHVTLVLCTVLHAFTHAYGSLLVPLYLLMTRSLALPGVGYASFIVTIYGLFTCVGSYPAGMLADRFDRKTILGIGLIGNALAVVAMGLTHNYNLLILLGILAGAFGTLFHPAANALIPEHYPASPGMAIGLLGIGSGVGFYAGPQFAGWRAQTAQWNIAGLSISDWQRPVIEAGVAGLIMGIVFLYVAREVRGRKRRLAYEGTAQGNSGEIRAAAAPARSNKGLGMRVAIMAAVLGCRDFAGLATLSLCSIYLQKAHNLDARRTGFILGAMMLVSVVVNPIAVWLSPGRRRLPTLATILILGGVVVATTPLWPVQHVLWALCLFMTFQLGSYSVSDAAILERVPSHVRGRVVGIFLTIAGTFAASSPWVMGFWTDRLGERAHEVNAYLPIFGTLGGMMVVSSLAMPLISALGPAMGAGPRAIEETSAATLEAVM
ncbi:MAG TPA: MFS transporter [Tepidisphaeraceae bacterium]|jgi:MFS family permease